MTMSALKLSIFVLSVVCTMTIINSTGVMEQHSAPVISTISGNATDGITKISSSASSDEINDNFFGLGSLLGGISVIKQLLNLLLLPGPYLVSHGFNDGALLYVAGFVQILFNTSLALGLIQIALKFGLGGNTV